jgi:formylglycine-generating enzyme required for sulfatase activity
MSVIPSMDLAVGIYDVTFDEWDACVVSGGCDAYSPADERWGRGRQPVINVSWDDAQNYVRWLNGRIRQPQLAASRAVARGPYRLPTSAEWEYAARAGMDATYSWGDEVGAGHANCRACGSVWDDKQAAPVAAFSPNRFGLYDMAGNVKQWVEDCTGAETGEGSASQQCPARVLRGGSWRSSPAFIRATSRDWAAPTYRFYDIGFRVVRSLDVTGDRRTDQAQDRAPP